MPIHQLIQQVMQRVHGVEKTQKHPTKKYAFAGYNEINERLREHFAQLGIIRQAAITSCADWGNGTVYVQGWVRYTDANDCSFFDIPQACIVPSQTSSKTFEPMQTGQALSYMVKAVELKLFALTGDNEPDVDAVDWERVAKHALPNGVPGEATGSNDPDALDEQLSVFETLGTGPDIQAHSDTLKQAWGTYRSLPNAVERLTKARTAAFKRVRESTPREPGQEG